MNAVRQDYQIVHLTYDCPEYELILIFNAQLNVLNVPLYPDEYIVLLKDHEVFLDETNTINIENTVPVESISALLLKRYK